MDRAKISGQLLDVLAASPCVPSSESGKPITTFLRQSVRLRPARPEAVVFSLNAKWRQSLIVIKFSSLTAAPTSFFAGIEGENRPCQISVIFRFCHLICSKLRLAQAKYGLYHTFRFANRAIVQL